MAGGWHPRRPPSYDRIGGMEVQLAGVDLEFLGLQVVSVLDGQREIMARLAAIATEMGAVKSALAETATRRLLLRVLRSFEGQVQIAGIRTEVLRESLEARVKAIEAGRKALEAGR